MGLLERAGRGAPHEGAADLPDFSRAAVVVAHPDDEILWFSSVVARVARIVICYGAIAPASERAEARRRVARQYPLGTLDFLDLPIPRTDLPEAEATSRLSDPLTKALAGLTTVFTHNAWGEYGQRDHRRVHDVVAALAAGGGVDLYVSAYVARHQRGCCDEVARRGIAETVTLPTDRRAVAPILALYRKHGCWTWTPNWRWPRNEHFWRLTPDSAAARTQEAPVSLFGARTQSRAEMRQFWRRLLPATARDARISNPGRERA